MRFYRYAVGVVPLRFLFTDIEGSTRRWEADADAMRAVPQASAQRYAFAIAKGQEPPMPGHHQHAVDLRVQQVAPGSQRTLLLGTLLQFALRAVLTVFVVGDSVV